ncbi:class E vacuolar protein-sorting machinery protein HSE1 [Phyllosticta capitalensis]|uniref:Class E vacuolar protein-sorting machinery protein HSE1 n=1 Tax=Phyllosticta capitalensis TaxID=121624 RepID=A0ABR1YN54_9PEZI
MFRAQQNQFDEVVVKATDENLTSENWEYILDVCDKVGATDSGARDVVAALIKRLAHRNANVQLYTLELANALSKNCGLKIHKELASRSFTDALLRLTNDRNTHQQVKAKILERMEEWTEMFSKSPELGIMEQAYMRLKTQNPTLRPPSKPGKTQITETDRAKEEEELQMALALSLKENTVPAPAAAKSNQPAAAPAQTPSQPPSHAIASGTTAATVSRVRALYDFTPSEPGELAFRKGDIIAVLESVYKDWWKGSLRGQVGIFPLNYVEKLQDPTREELEREAQMEAEVFGQIKNVEKLLALLSTTSTADARDNEEVTTLYHQVVAIRPKLIELIGKYSQKKDDFTQLNEKFIKARRDYEALLEASMSQAGQPGYGRPPFGYAGPPPGAPYNAYAAQGPPQQDPQQRYYSPGPAGGYQPPQNAPTPFFMVAPGQTPSAPGVSSPTPATSDPYAQQQRVASGGRPQSMAYPHEMAANSPVETRPQPQQQPYESYQPQQTQAGAQAYPAQAPPQQHQQPSAPYDSPSAYQSQQTPGGPSDPYQQQQQAPPQPSQPPPAVPGSSSPAQTYVAYQAYQPPAQQQPQMWNQGPSAPPVGGRDEAEGFYR